MIQRAICALALSLSLVSPSFAQEATKSYRVALMGIPVGNLEVAQTRTGNDYTSRSNFETSGIVAVIRDVGFIMRSRGTGTGAAMDPSFYRERMNTGERQSRGKVEFAAGDSRWDPNSAMLYVLGDRPVSAGCGFNAEVFDGKRSHQLLIRDAQITGNTLTCSGQLARTGGYTAGQLAQLKGYTFNITYGVRGDVLTFQSATVDTLYGKATLSTR